jgi:hypothetical protein
MADTSADEFSQFPVESIARFLSVCGNEDPGLIRRARARTNVEMRPSAPAPRPEMRRPAGQESYLEELVSIAIASARQAEDAARQVHSAGTSARRRMYAISAFGAVGLLVGAVAVGGVESGYELRWGHTATGGATLAAVSPSVGAQATPAGNAVAAATAHKEDVQVRVADVSAGSLGLRVTLPAPPATAKEPLTTKEATTPAPVSGPAATELQLAEDTLHANATAQASARASAAPSEAAPVAVASAVPPAIDKPDTVFVPPQPLPSPVHPVQVAGATRVHSGGEPPTSPSQLVAAVQALEALTDERPAGRSGSGAKLRQFDNRM